MSQKHFISVFLNWECVVIETSVLIASLSFIDRRTMDHGLLYGFWRQHEPQTSPWSKVSASATNLMVFIESTDHQRQQFPLPKHRPPTPLWFPLAAQVSNMNMDSFLRCYASHWHNMNPSENKFMDINTASFRQLNRQRTSTSSLVVVAIEILCLAIIKLWVFGLRNLIFYNLLWKF